MPGVNGFEVCREIKQNPETSNCRILVLTGYPDESNIKRILEYGADPDSPDLYGATPVHYALKRHLPRYNIEAVKLLPKDDTQSEKVKRRLTELQNL